MNGEEPIVSLPAAWLRPLPQGYRIPPWRWVVLPATAIMLKWYGGVWVSGAVRLMADRVAFVETGLTGAPTSSDVWSIALADIADVAVRKGLATVRLDIVYPGGVIKLMTARAEEFVARLDEARARR